MSELFDEYRDTYVDEVQKSIGFIGQEHDFFTRSKARNLLEIIGEAVGDPTQARVLDVGCGPGETDAYLADKVGELHGVDVASELIARASERNPSVSYTAYDGERLPYDDGTFDFAFAICVVHHVPPAKWDRFVAEIARVVRPGGAVAIAEHNPYNPLTRLAVHRCEFDEDAVLLSLDRARRLQREAGLATCTSRYILFFPWSSRLLERAERVLRRIPLGAQYIAVGRREG
jgi:SAM-dependent methyltransferase